MKLLFVCEIDLIYMKNGIIRNSEIAGRIDQGVIKKELVIFGDEAEFFFELAFNGLVEGFSAKNMPADYKPSASKGFIGAFAEEEFFFAFTFSYNHKINCWDRNRGKDFFKKRRGYPDVSLHIEIPIFDLTSEIFLLAILAATSDPRFKIVRSWTLDVRRFFF